MVRKSRKRVQKRTGGYGGCEPEEESVKKCQSRGESGKSGDKVPGSGRKWKNRERSVRIWGKVAESGMKCQEVERYDAG